MAKRSHEGQFFVSRDLFPTEARAYEALQRALDLHKRKGRTVIEKWDGPILRFEVTDQDGEFVAAHWLSETDESADHP